MSKDVMEPHEDIDELTRAMASASVEDKVWLQQVSVSPPLEVNQLQTEGSGSTLTSLVGHSHDEREPAKKTDDEHELTKKTDDERELTEKTDAGQPEKVETLQEDKERSGKDDDLTEEDVEYPADWPWCRYEVGDNPSSRKKIDVDGPVISDADLELQVIESAAGVQPICITVNLAKCISQRRISAWIPALVVGTNGTFEVLVCCHSYIDISKGYNVYQPGFGHAYVNSRDNFTFKSRLLEDALIRFCKEIFEKDSRWFAKIRSLRGGDKVTIYGAYENVQLNKKPKRITPPPN